MLDLWLVLYLFIWKNLGEIYQRYNIRIFKGVQEKVLAIIMYNDPGCKTDVRKVNASTKKKSTNSYDSYR